MDCQFPSQSQHPDGRCPVAVPPNRHSRLVLPDNPAQRSSPLSAQPVTINFVAFEPAFVRQNVVASMSLSERHESYVELAVDVLKTQNLASITALKDFLTVLSNPLAVETVLREAIARLAEDEIETCYWILRHPSYLMPDLDLMDLALKFAFAKLQEGGFISGQEFDFNATGQLYVSPAAKSQLFAGTSKVDRLLLEEVLQIRN